MKIDPDRLRTLRQQKGFTRPQLAKQSGITVRTIQRLENEPHQSQKTREDTLNRLAKALSVEPGVLTGELPLPESDKTHADNPDRVQIGAQIAPKTRLAYDLIKRRYGVNATEIINMAPLFFVLLAEDSLAWRRKKLKEAKEAYADLEKIEGFWDGGLSRVEHYMDKGVSAEKDSIDRADLFGEYLEDNFMGTPFDSSKNNPFTHHLRKLADELDSPEVVDVDEGVLNIRSDFKFPHYEICREELDQITNGSEGAKRTLETGCAQLSKIPEELMKEDASEERAKWLANKLLNIYKEMDEKPGDMMAEAVAKDKSGKLKKSIEEYSKKKEKGDDE